MRNEKDKKMTGVEVTQIRLPAGKLFAAMIPEDGRKRSGAVRLIQKAVQQQFAALEGYFLGLDLSVNDARQKENYSKKSATFSD